MKHLNILLSSLAVLMGLIASAQETMPADTLALTDTIAAEIQEAVPMDTIPAMEVEATATNTVSRQTTADQLAGNLYCLDATYSFDANTFREYNGPDFHFFKNTTNPAVKPCKFMDDQTWVGIPVFVAGMIAKAEKTAFRQDYNNENTKIRLIKYNFHSEIDNYTQFSGIALTAGLKMAGVEGRSSWPRLTASSLASYAVMAGFVNSIKYTASEMRPDGSTRNSWPSGHTATAFVGATILHKEYGLTRSPWYSIAGYSLATATGVMRVLNNRHWVSDVLSGAGIGILSTELAYGICDLLFKDKGLLMNDLSYYPDLRENPSFFSISMGVGLGNKNLVLPPFVFEVPESLRGDEPTSYVDDQPLHLMFRSATAVGAEGAWFFSPYVGVGGRLRVKSTPINGWSSFAKSEEEELKNFTHYPIFLNSIHKANLVIESDHITEFAADAGLYFSLPLSSRFAIGSKLLMGRSVMDDIDVKGVLEGNVVSLDMESDDFGFIPTDEKVTCEWDYINVHASNSLKFGTGLSLTYAHKNSFSWRLFCDYDYSHKTFTASYTPLGFMEDFSPLMHLTAVFAGWDMSEPMTTSAKKHLHQWVLGGALCVSF